MLLDVVDVYCIIMHVKGTCWLHNPRDPMSVVASGRKRLRASFDNLVHVQIPIGEYRLVSFEECAIRSITGGCE